jgi:hypothetical protein
MGVLMTGFGSKSRASWRVSGGIAGIIFAIGALVVLIFIQGSGPVVGDPIAEMREFFENDAASYFVFIWIGSLLYVFAFLPFASALRSLFAADDIDAGIWSRLSFAAAILVVAVVGIGTVFWSALALNGPSGFSDSTVAAFVSADAIAFYALTPWAFALFLVASSVVVVRSGVMWKWLGYLGLLAALLLVIGAFWVLDGDPSGALAIVGMIGFFAGLLWSLLAGYVLMTKEDTA